MSKHTLTTTSDDGLKVETLTVKDVSPELIKALDAFAGMTERAKQERSEMNSEEALGRADADCWFLEVLTQATNRIVRVRVCGNSSFATTRAKCFNVKIREYQQDLRARREIANKRLATLRNQMKP